MTKIAKNDEEAWKIQEQYEGKPHGWVQWKGTNVCMDVYCKCGYHSHIDSDFVYNIQCPNCGTIYMVNGHVEFIEIEEGRDSGCLKVSELDYADKQYMK